MFLAIKEEMFTSAIKEETGKKRVTHDPQQNPQTIENKM